MLSFKNLLNNNKLVACGLAMLALTISTSIGSDAFCTRAYAETKSEAFANMDIEKKMDRAFDLVKNKDYGKALEICNGLIAEYPRDPQLFMARGLFKSDMKDYKGALADLDTAISIYPKLKYAYVFRAEMNLRQGNWEATIKDVEKEIENGTSSPIRCYLYRASAYEKLNNYEMAIADLTRLIAIDDKKPEYYSKRSSLYVKERKYAQALVDIDKALELAPDVVANHVKKYNIQLKMKYYIGALESIDKVIALEKDNIRLSKALAKKSNVLYLVKRYDESIAAAEKAVQLDPDNVNAYFYRGISKSSRYQDGSGISDLTICINKNYKLLQAYYVRGFGYHSEKNYAAALKDYTKAIELNPKFERFYLSRGMCYASLGNLEAAKKDYNKVIEMAPGTTDAESAQKELARLQ